MFQFIQVLNGFLDQIDASDVTRFEQAFMTEVRNKHQDVLSAISSEKKISDETDAKLKSILEKFVKAFA